MGHTPNSIVTMNINAGKEQLELKNNSKLLILGGTSSFAKDSSPPFRGSISN